MIVSHLVFSRAVTRLFIRIIYRREIAYSANICNPPLQFIQVERKGLRSLWNLEKELQHQKEIDVPNDVRVRQ